MSGSSSLQWYLFACVSWHQQTAAINRGAKAWHVGVQVGAATDGPAERVDVLQPFLSGQRTHDPLEGAAFRPKQALLSAPAGIWRLMVSMRL